MNFILKSKMLTLSLVLALSFLSPFFSYAQKYSDEKNLSENAISSLETELSKPTVELDVLSNGRVGQSVKISAYTTNIVNETSDFLWYIDDVFDQKNSGKAKSDISFITTKENHVVRLVIEENNQKITENSILVNSYDIAMTWYADTYVPPEYPGKAMPSRESRVTVTAIPNIKGYEAKDLLYTWYLDAESRVRSVLGEQEFSFIVTKNTDSLSVLVEVSNLSGSVLVEKAILIPIVRPSVVIYHKNSEKETETALSEISILPGGSVNLTAKPFNFQAKRIADFDYLWKFIGKEVRSKKTKPNILTLAIPKNSFFGNRELTVNVSNRKIFKEIAASVLTVKITDKQ